MRLGTVSAVMLKLNFATKAKSLSLHRPVATIYFSPTFADFLSCRAQLSSLSNLYQNSHWTKVMLGERQVKV